MIIIIMIMMVMMTVIMTLIMMVIMMMIMMITMMITMNMLMMMMRIMGELIQLHVEPDLGNGHGESNFGTSPNRTTHVILGKTKRLFMGLT